jgi:hypothetical protein
MSTASRTLVIRTSQHPDPSVRDGGRTLTDPYLEHCWVAVLGPTAVLALRRLAVLASGGRVVSIAVEDLAASLGVGRGTGRHAQITRTLDRIVAFRFATWSGIDELTVFETVPVLGRNQLERAPLLTRELHVALHRRDVADVRGAEPR